MMASRSTTKTPTEEKAACADCDYLEREFAKNPGGLPAKNKGLIFVALAGYMTRTLT